MLTFSRHFLSLLIHFLRIKSSFSADRGEENLRFIIWNFEKKPRSDESIDRMIILRWPYVGVFFCWLWNWTAAVWLQYGNGVYTIAICLLQPKQNHKESHELLRNFELWPPFTDRVRFEHSLLNSRSATKRLSWQKTATRTPMTQWLMLLKPRYNRSSSILLLRKLILLVSTMNPNPPLSSH